MEAFEFIKKKQTKTAIDIKLIDMLDTRMKKCFENANNSVVQEEGEEGELILEDD